MKAEALLFALALAATPALGQSTAPKDNCPADMQAIDDAVPNLKQRTAAQLNEITRLRDQGGRLHKEGKHPEAMVVLAKAKQIIGIK